MNSTQIPCYTSRKKKKKKEKEKKKKKKKNGGEKKEERKWWGTLITDNPKGRQVLTKNILQKFEINVDMLLFWKHPDSAA